MFSDRFSYSDTTCKIYTTLEMFYCNCTCLHLAFVNMDGFLRVKDKFRHTRVTTTCSTLLWISASWTIAAIQSVAHFMLSLKDSHVLDHGVCFVRDTSFIVLGSVFSFVVPVIAAVTFQVLRQKELRKLTAQKSECERRSGVGELYRYQSMESFSTETESTLTDATANDETNFETN